MHNGSLLAPPTDPNFTTPLRLMTQEENLILARYVTDYGALDHAGTIGFLTAIASSPTKVPFEECQAALHGNTRGADANVIAHFSHLLCLSLNTIGFQLANDQPYGPEDDDEAACRSFARGYLAGVDLWPSAVSLRARLSCAGWAYALSGRLGGVRPEDMTSLRRELGSLLILTYDILGQWSVALAQNTSAVH